MKISGLLISAGFFVAALGRVAAQQTCPLYSGTVPNSQPSRVEETSAVNGTVIVICPGGGYSRL